tara:strand:+ start:251 stop:448 length:198 start_codon:yes stop_codon:yes gene_type:complete
MKNALSPAMPTGTTESHGLTKREYTAIEAMSALIKAYGVSNTQDPLEIRRLAYEHADAMLAKEPL